ncbi:ferredoxin [Prauserella marina]|uniref:Ferredoxin n=1 Tax=Prauserella marina TaxID=530584 RepID=A0A1G6I7Y1_9PSEU|nr:ferredoxin [Prauserella marina]SDC02538.1 ferredoxin [Prauserella marina]
MRAEAKGAKVIEADRDVCIGAGMCALTAPAVFDQDDEDGRVLVLDEQPPASEAGVVREAVELCPSGALTLRDT